VRQKGEKKRIRLKEAEKGEKRETMHKTIRRGKEPLSPTDHEDGPAEKVPRGKAMSLIGGGGGSQAGQREKGRGRRQNIAEGRKSANSKIERKKTEKNIRRQSC